MSTLSFRILSCLLPLCLVLMSWAAGQEPGAVSPVGFYGAPTSGPVPLEVHFHHQCDESVEQSVSKWEWVFGDGDSSEDPDTSHIYEASGRYTVSLTVTMENGDKHTSTREDYIAAGDVSSANDGDVTQVETAPEDEMKRSEEADASVLGDGLVFIHHSCGENWLNSGLHNAIVAKDYVGTRNDITYGVDLEPDAGRPDSLGDVPGDLTDMHHWILWFNDYFDAVTDQGQNRIVIFKSCFPNSHVDGAGEEPGDPFSDWKTVANYRAVFRHPAGFGRPYEMEGTQYLALQDVFARNPQTLFIFVSAPPECWTETDSMIAAHARTFNNWVKGEWLRSYKSETGLNNVAVFDWFDVLAEPEAGSFHPNQLRREYGGNAGDSHPNDQANDTSTRLFVSGKNNFIDQAWAAFQSR
ncbi:MAG: hypothetical protein AMXMBFR84_43550 [Candidatus Hydrogenedentota bacterium]